MPNTELNIANLRKRIESRLGGKGVTVELEQDDYIECMKATLDCYNQRRPFTRHRKLNATVTQSRYELNPVDHPGLAGVIYCQFITRRGEPSQVDPFDPFDSALAGVSLGSGSGETYGELALRMSYSEDVMRVVDSEPDWHGDWEGAVYVLYVDIARAHVLASYEWTGHYTPDQNANTGMQLIPNGDVEWFVKYATACGKETLGRVRGKFQGITNSDGAQDPVDYQELLQEAQQEKERLEAELDRRRPPLAPIIE